MKRNEQIILGSLVLIGLVAAFWLLVLSPKRHEASKLQDEIAQLQSSLSKAKQGVAAGQQARKSFGIDYRRMVVLGKAVPADSEQTSLFVQLQNLADRSGVAFQSIDLGDASSSGASAVPPPTSTSSTDSSTSTDGSTSTSTSGSTTSSSTSSSTSSTATDTATSAPASEASVSTLPIGAAVGPAGLPVMPYGMTFRGDFFQIADFMKRLDGLVHVQQGLANVRGRLLTVDGFTLSPADDSSGANPQLTADLSVTTFLSPPDQGITAGATPSGPGASTPTLTSSSTATATTDSSSAPTTSETSTTPTTTP